MKNIIETIKVNKKLSAIRKSAEKEFGKDIGRMIYKMAILQACEELRSV